jgi:predicted dehydrogenase
MFTIVGSGFGLYGYLPAVVEGLGEEVVLPRAYEARGRARPELERALAGVRWVADAEAALAEATAIVIATPPARQLEVAARCAALPRIERIVLEKPVAVTPALAQALLEQLRAAGKRVRVGYTLLDTQWHRDLRWPRSGGEVALTWTFMAHHFARDLANWKRRHDEGGGVLRFFGVHLLALLAHHGYEEVKAPVLEGEVPGEPERWSALFSGPGLPDCHVRVDSRSTTDRFEIAMAGGVSVAALQDPFERERAEAGADRRVGVLVRLLRSFDSQDRPWDNLYARTNDLWRQAEGG